MYRCSIMEKTAETAIYQQKSIIFATAFEDKRNNYPKSVIRKSFLSFSNDRH